MIIDRRTETERYGLMVETMSWLGHWGETTKLPLYMILSK
jgi:hypothetical protein